MSRPLSNVVPGALLRAERAPRRHRVIPPRLQQEAEASAGPPEDALAVPDELRSPPAQDVHLRIWLGGIAFDYRAAAMAARTLIEDWQRKRWYAIELLPTSIQKCRLLPRLPNERLFLGPAATRQTSSSNRLHTFGVTGPRPANRTDIDEICPRTDSR
ncbi:hypothetical protein [Nocardia fusca]|uniref:Uncharacterized protein n=1 Tax=Nocardia fusca TaxID=941183 RepID=A0ABV3FAQ1_9NOCA